VLFVIGKDEAKKIKGIEVVKANELLVSDLAANGARLCVFSEEGVKELENLMTDKKISNTQKINKTIKQTSEKEKEND